MKQPPQNDPLLQGWLAITHIAFVDFDGQDLCVYTASGFKIGFLGDLSAREEFATAIIRSKAKWIRIPDTLQPMALGIAR